MLLPTPESYPWERSSVRMRGRGMSASQLETRPLCGSARGRVRGRERGWASARNRAAPCRSRTRRRTRFPSRMFGSGSGARPGARGRRAFPQDRGEPAWRFDVTIRRCPALPTLPDFVPACRQNAGPGLDFFFAPSGAGSQASIPAGAALLLPGWSSTMEFRQGQEFVPGGDSGSGGGPVEFRPGQAFFPGGGFLTANAGEFVPPSRGADVRVPEFRPVSSRSLACGVSCYSAAAARALPGCALVPGSNCGRSRCRALGRIAPGHACLRA